MNGISGRKIVEGKILKNLCVPTQADNRKFQTQGFPHHPAIHFPLREWSHGAFNATWVGAVTEPSVSPCPAFWQYVPVIFLYHWLNYIILIHTPLIHTASDRSWIRGRIPWTKRLEKILNSWSAPCLIKKLFFDTTSVIQKLLSYIQKVSRTLTYFWTESCCLQFAWFFMLP